MRWALFLYRKGLRRKRHQQGMKKAGTSFINEFLGLATLSFQGAESSALINISSVVLHITAQTGIRFLKDRLFCMCSDNYWQAKN